MADPWEDSRESENELVKKRLFIYLGILMALGITYASREFAKQRSEPRVVSRTESPDGTAVVSLLSSPYELDRIYESMQGPSGPQRGVQLLDTPEPELVWITGVRSEVVGLDGKTAKSPEFFCHANLTLDEVRSDPVAHNDLFDSTTHLDWRLFTLVPGRMEVFLPPGFGIPVLSSERFDYFTMSLNMNVTDRTETVRVKTSIELVRDRLADRWMTPVFRRAIYGWEPLLEDDELPSCHVGAHPGESCGDLGGLSASTAGSSTIGGKRTIHWYLPPGPYEAKRDVTEQLDLPFDSTVHYVTAHLHPFGKSVILRDITAAADVFEIESSDYENIRGVRKMEEFSFPEGIAIYQDHEYELITTYENTSGELMDAMSIVYLYLLDKDFRRPGEVPREVADAGSPHRALDSS